MLKIADEEYSDTCGTNIHCTSLHWFSPGAHLDVEVHRGAFIINIFSNSALRMQSIVGLFTSFQHDHYSEPTHAQKHHYMTLMVAGSQRKEHFVGQIPQPQTLIPIATMV